MDDHKVFLQHLCDLTPEDSHQLTNIDISQSLKSERANIQDELKRCEMRLSELFERLHLYSLDPANTRQGDRADGQKEKQPELAELQQQLTPDSLLLTYFLHQGKLIIFAISRERIFTYIHPDGAVQLKRMIPLLHLHLQPLGWRNPQEPPQNAIRGLLHKLYQLLIAPIADFLPTSSGTLTIVPYGPLRHLPFHALYDGAHFLIESQHISYLPAASFLLHSAQRDRTESHEEGKHETALGQPLVLGYSGRHLKHALDEAQLIAARLQADSYLEDEATIAHLVEQAPGRPIIHLATHGQSRLDAPNFSYLRLADGRFNAIDAFRLDLRACELVTLSGCETGLSLIGGGDEQLSLGRAFLAAGASSLLISLWPVEDNATHILMESFYQQLQAGASKVQALRTAQSSLLHSAKPMYSHPYYWAAFRLIGNPGR